MESINLQFRHKMRYFIRSRLFQFGKSVGMPNEYFRLSERNIMIICGCKTNTKYFQNGFTSIFTYKSTAMEDRKTVK